MSRPESRTIPDHAINDFVMKEGINGWKLANGVFTKQLARSFFSPGAKGKLKFLLVSNGLRHNNRVVIAFSIIYVILEVFGNSASRLLLHGSVSPTIEDFTESLLKYVFFLGMYIAANMLAKRIINDKRQGFPSPRKCARCENSGWVTNTGEINRGLFEQYFVCPICNGVGSVFCIMEKGSLEAYPIFEFVGKRVCFPNENLTNDFEE